MFGREEKLEFVGRADSQVVRKICVVVFALRRSVSFYSSLANWKLSNSQSLRTSAHTGVAIPRIEVPFLVNEFREMAG